jgi:hypothetical protein
LRARKNSRIEIGGVVEDTENLGSQLDGMAGHARMKGVDQMELVAMERKRASTSWHV